LAEGQNNKMQLGYFIQAQATKLFLLVFKLAGLRGGSWLGSLLGVFLGKIVKERQIAEDNLHQAMPTLSKAEREQILNKCWRQLGRVIGEFPHMKKIAREAEARIIIEGKENVDAVLSNGGPALFLSGHFSNWEVMMLGIKRVAGDSGAIYRRANNPFIEKWVKKQRGTFETTQITKGRNGTRAMIELLKAKTSLAILVDQKLGRGDPIEFFGRQTRAPSAAAKLSRRFDIPLIPTVISRRTDGPDSVHFVQKFFPAIQVAKTDNMQADIDAAMREMYDLLEQWITERPEEWFWQHNRWK
jgi:KDO2-lipid IV(A) lauroyltransferase